MKFNIETLKGFPLNNDQKETLLGLIKKMCDEGNATTKPTQSNEPIQITVYPNPNSTSEWFVSTKFGTTLDQHISVGEDLVLSLYTSDDELFEYVEKHIQNCTFELVLCFNGDINSWIRTNQYMLTYNIQDGVLNEHSCNVHFELKIDSIILNINIRIEKR